MVVIRESYVGMDKAQPVESFINTIKNYGVVLKSNIDYQKGSEVEKVTTKAQMNSYLDILKFARQDNVTMSMIHLFLENKLQCIPKLEDCDAYQIGQNIAYTQAYNVCDSLERMC